MILQALHDLHERLVKDPAYDVAPDGYSLQKISFVIVLNPDGTLYEIQDHRLQDGRQKRPQTHLVPGGAKPTGPGFNPCFLWDNSSYLMGYKPDDEKPERTTKCFEASRDHHEGFEAALSDPGYRAVCRYFRDWECSAALEHAPILADISTGFGVFQIRGETRFVHEHDAIDAWWKERHGYGDERRHMGTCLLTGETMSIAELHQPKIKGVQGAQGAGALIVSFNKKAYDSYGKDAGFNAPVSEEAATNYCKALNALLASGKHRLQIGDATTVFWTEEKTVVEASLGAWFSGDGQHAPAQNREKLGEIEGVLRSVQRGGRPQDVLGQDSEVRFYILGLTGQAGGRIGVRFWHCCTLGDLFEKLARHHADMAIERQWGDDSKRPDPEFPQVWQLLRQTAREPQDIPPNLGGALIRAILTGGPYPQVLASAVINRIRADREVPYLRVAILKGWLCRLNKAKGMGMSLSEDNQETSYRLGRLFAALEKTQEDALGGVGASIRDCFYSSASATPGSVFPRLLRMYQHHLAKLEGGAKVNREKLVQAILDPVKGFPSNFNLKDQGQFAIGYYHQRQRFFANKDDRMPAS